MEFNEDPISMLEEEIALFRRLEDSASKKAQNWLRKHHTYARELLEREQRLEEMKRNGAR